MFKTLKADIDAVMERDPAARSRAEVFFSTRVSRRCVLTEKPTGVCDTTSSFLQGGFLNAVVTRRELRFTRVQPSARDCL